MIKPTVGRVVLYKGEFPETAAAIVVRVWSDTCVNLTVFDPSGCVHSRTSVTLRQPEDEAPQGSFCEWMPYQQGQAAKTEALGKKLSEAEKQ